MIVLTFCFRRLQYFLTFQQGTFSLQFYVNLGMKIFNGGHFEKEYPC